MGCFLCVLSTCGGGTVGLIGDASTDLVPAGGLDARADGEPFDSSDGPAVGSGGARQLGSGGSGSGGSGSGGATASGGSGSGGFLGGTGGLPLPGSGGNGLGGRPSPGSGGSASGGTSGRSGSGGANGSGGSATPGSGGATGSGGSGDDRGLPVGQPWVAFYGSPAATIDLAKVAATFRTIDIDADPDVGFTPAQITTLRSAGQNRVLSYMNVGSCESFRSYYASAPSGHESCQSSGALTAPYLGFSDEMWADLSNAAYQDLIVNYVAPRLAARGVDGFFLDNMEVVEHGPTPSQGGPCGATCAQGGLDLVWQLRQKFPDKLIVMQNAVAATTRNGSTHGVPYSSLLDGISVESLFADGSSTVMTDTGSLADVKAWQKLALLPGGHAFWFGAEDYLGACSASNKAAALSVYALADSNGLDEYVTDMSGEQHVPCYWSDFP